MSNQRHEGVNLLKPETKEPVLDSDKENLEAGTKFEVSVPAAEVDQTKVSHVKADLQTQLAQAQEIPKDKLQVDLENILSENLEDIYAQLPAAKQEQFRQEGEKLAQKVRTMVVNVKLQAHKVLKLLIAWLRLIPGVNVYFLRQEAKIKLDKIVDYAEAYKKKKTTQL